MFPAVCDSCAQRYQVPDPERRYRCARCGEGSVIPEGVAPPRPPTEDVDSSVPCDACGAVNLPGANFCESCGASVGLPEGILVGESGDRAHVSRNVARWELERIEKSVRRIRGLYALSVILNGLALLLLFSRVRGVDRALEDRLAEVPSEVWKVILLVLGLHVAIALCGMFFARKRPMFWCVLFACIHSLRLVMQILAGTLVAIAIEALFAIAGWRAVNRVARLRPLLAAHPELHKRWQVGGV